MSVQLPIIKKIPPRRCVGTRHHRYLGQTDNVNNAVSRLMIMGNLKDMILRKKIPETGFFRRRFFLETRFLCLSPQNIPLVRRLGCKNPRTLQLIALFVRYSLKASFV
ncbi:hypothetical protein [Microseira wollei]|uniref:Transposase n=1 Tax=Microseira wollei NIES-4236 TaxID=2530354 RepID=A0AAV3XHC8_9CYAN|nr:hypothetical protein [Microseira wollei]GET38892.1 hypothetical protein MiSe_36520 [Microseira wollei NIES-4236]